jgi:hypothetical protein
MLNSSELGTVSPELPEHTLAGAGMVVLHEIEVNSMPGKRLLVVALEEEATLVLEAVGLDDQYSVEIGSGDANIHHQLLTADSR